MVYFCPGFASSECEELVPAAVTNYPDCNGQHQSECPP